MPCKKIYHEVKVEDLPALEEPTVPQVNEGLFRLYLEMAKFHGGKLHCLIAGPDICRLLVNLPGSLKELKDEPFYYMGHHGKIPIYVDASLGAGDILVVCKYGAEKIRVLDWEPT